MLYDELKGLEKGSGKLEGNVQRDAGHNGRDARATRSRGYVFPEQAKMYEENPDGITWRVKKILAVALGEVAEDENALPEVSEDTARKRGEEYIAKLDAGEKRVRMAVVFKHYMEGKSIEEVMELTKMSKGSVSGYLNEIEQAIGCVIVRGHGGTPSMADRLSADTGLLWVKRAGGTRRASVRDFHSFRVTWVTLALTAGVPLELVQKVTGHKTTDIVLKHYFQPGREAFRQALQTAMPKLLTNGQKSPKEEMREIVEGMTAKTWKRDRKRLLELMKAG
jgi:hypothetical protein